MEQKVSVALMKYYRAYNTFFSLPPLYIENQISDKNLDFASLHQGYTCYACLPTFSFLHPALYAQDPSDSEEKNLDSSLYANSRLILFLKENIRLAALIRKIIVGVIPEFRILI